MSPPTPDVPRRFEHSVEVPGTPEQVWQALATAGGISAWMMPTDVEEGLGGRVVFHMGETDSVGEITAWDPPRRLIYQEDWASLAGQDPATVTPLVSEFVVEATSGGTCVVRVVTSAFGTGADWENEFFADMELGWAPMFEHLRLYLTHFPGQTATNFEADAAVPGKPAEVAAAMRESLGVREVGQTVEAQGVTGLVERVADDGVLLRLSAPVPGLLALYSFRGEDPSSAYARVGGYLFSDDAPAYVERETASWKSWLESLAVPAA
jgi:uncharacterized protein YndB with AHSA1/START domain